MIQFLKLFGFASAASIAAIVAATILLGPGALVTILLLSILEVTFSFDNAVVNARILERLSKFWQEIFLTIGILIAVFGMRIVFPILLVDITSQLNFGEVINLALNNPEAYTHYLELAMPSIAAFGGAFLMMVFLGYFVIDNEEPYWVRPLERFIHRFPRHVWTVAIAVLAVVVLVANFVARQEDMLRVLIAGSIGVGVYVLIHVVVALLEKREKKQLRARKTALTGLAAFTTFMYLEVLDASFSLDGVIGAFAISSSVIVIAVGLGIGAIWVRSMTIALVRHKTLARFRYLSSGAHWAIGVLSVVLFLSVSLHVPEIFTGLVGVSIIGLSVIGSLRAQRQSRAS